MEQLQSSIKDDTKTKNSIELFLHENDLNIKDMQRLYPTYESKLLFELGIKKFL